MMKLKLYFFVIAVCTGMFQQASGQLTSGLIAHWPFNGNANDASGNGYNGTATNVTYITGLNGISNTAALFNGTSSYVDVAYQSGLNLTSFSICAVVKINGYYTGTCQGNILLQRGADFQSGHYTLQFSDNAFNSCNVSDTSKHVFYSHVRNKVPLNSTLQYTPTIVSGNWYCVVSTFENDTMRIYVNGVLKNTVQLSSGALGTSTDGLSIGASRMGSFIQFPYWLNGAIDDLRLYNRVLSAGEVSSYCGSLLDTIVYISQPISDTAFCANDTFHLSYGTTYPFQPGNVFTAQLSNSSGSFASPVTIGTVTATGGGTIICTIPSNVQAGTGYRVRIVSGNPVRTSGDNGVNLDMGPAPNIAGSSNSPVCEGKTIQLTAASTTTGVSYNWTGPSGFSNPNQNPSIPSAASANAGNYIVTATATGCSAKDTVSVIVNPTPAKPVVGSNSPVCTKSSINLTAGSTTGATYSWSGPSNFSSTSQNPSRSNASLAMGGYYKVIASLNGCSSMPDSVLVNVVAGPEIGAIPSPGNVVCQGDSITFLAFTSNAGTGATYQWMKNGSPIPGANALKYVAGGLATGDVISITLIPGAGGSCSSPVSSINIPVTVLQYKAPAVAISAIPNTPVWEGLLVTFTATTTDAGANPKYQWKLNGQDVQGATGQTWGATTLKNNDVISCEIISDYKCPQPKNAASNQLTLTVLTGIDDMNTTQGVHLFPNPNSGDFTITGLTAGKATLVEVVNTLGQVVYSKNITAGGKSDLINIRCGNLPAGVYILKLNTGDNQQFSRFRVL